MLTPFVSVQPLPALVVMSIRFPNVISTSVAITYDLATGTIRCGALVVSTAVFTESFLSWFARRLERAPCGCAVPAAGGLALEVSLAAEAALAAAPQSRQIASTGGTAAMRMRILIEALSRPGKRRRGRTSFRALSPRDAYRNRHPRVRSAFSSL